MLLTQRAPFFGSVCLVAMLASVEVQRSCWGFHMGLFLSQSLQVPRGPPSPPPPVHHSPPRKLTAKELWCTAFESFLEDETLQSAHQDQKDWKIPPCISNWKNAKAG